MTDLKNFSEKFLTSPGDSPQGGLNGAQVMRNSAAQQAAMEAFFFGYQAFTAKPDEMLAKLKPNLDKAVEEVIKNGNFDLVLERGAVIDVKPQYDITRQVIERMNQMR